MAEETQETAEEKAAKEQALTEEKAAAGKEAKGKDSKEAEELNALKEKLKLATTQLSGFQTAEKKRTEEEQLKAGKFQEIITEQKDKLKDAEERAVSAERKAGIQEAVLDNENTFPKAAIAKLAERIDRETGLELEFKELVTRAVAEAAVIAGHDGTKETKEWGTGAAGAGRKDLKSEELDRLVDLHKKMSDGDQRAKVAYMRLRRVLTEKGVNVAKVIRDRV
jgi:hypothetical protein